MENRHHLKWRWRHDGTGACSTEQYWNVLEVLSAIMIKSYYGLYLGFINTKISYNSLGHVNLADGYTVCISTKARMLFCCSTWHGVPMPSCPKGWSTAAATSTQPHWHRPLQILNGSRGDRWSLKISKLLPGRTAHQAPGLKDHARRLQPHHSSGSRWSGHAGRSGKHGCGTHSKEPGTDHIPDLAAADNFAAAIGGYGMDEPLLIWSKRARYCKKVIF